MRPPTRRHNAALRFADRNSIVGRFPPLEPTMRYLVCLVAGLILGTLIALTAANIMGQRNAWPRAVMTVMQHELGRARDAVRQDRCTIEDADAAAAHLKLLASDIEPALLAPGAHDRVFSQYASDLREAVSAFSQAGSDCVARRAAVTKVANACDACHRDYK